MKNVQTYFVGAGLLLFVIMAVMVGTNVLAEGHAHASAVSVVAQTR